MNRREHIPSHDQPTTGRRGRGVPRPAIGHWRRRPAFTVMEVMMAMGIFVVGFTAVISLFPAAIVMQRETVDDLTIQQITADARTVLTERPITVGELTALGASAGGYSDPDLPAGLYPLPMAPTAVYENPPPVNRHLLFRYPITERSYPDDTDVSNRRYFWVPMVRKIREFNTAAESRPEDWAIYAFIVRVDQPYGEDTDGDGIKDDFDAWYKPGQGTRVRNVPGISAFGAYGNLSPLPGDVPDDGTNNRLAEWPFVPKVCSIEAEVVPNTQARRFELAEGNMIDASVWGYTNAASAELDPTHYKIHPGDLVVDQWGRTHTVVDADHESITLRDSLYDPTSAVAPDYELRLFGDPGPPYALPTTIYFWYVPAAAVNTGGGSNYAAFEIGPAAQSPLRAVVQIPNAVIR